MKKLAVVVFSITILVSCRSGRTIQDSSKDSTASNSKEVIITKDSLITVPADSSWLKALLECDSNGNVLMKELLQYNQGKKLNIPKTSIEDNRLFIVCNMDSFDIYQKYASIYYSKDTSSFFKKNEIVTLPPIETNVLTGFQKFMIKSAWCFYSLLLLYGGYKLARWIIRLKINPLNIK